MVYLRYFGVFTLSCGQYLNDCSSHYIRAFFKCHSKVNSTINSLHYKDNPYNTRGMLTGGKSHAYMTHDYLKNTIDISGKHLLRFQIR